MPPAKRKQEQPKATPEVKPDVPLPEDDQAALQRYEEALAAGFSEAEARDLGWPTAAEANETADGVQDADADEAASDDEAPAENDAVVVEDPCAVCYPGGWDALEPGAHVSCFHGLGIRQGEPMLIPRSVAEACGLV